jgi:hypothetical protein
VPSTKYGARNRLNALQRYRRPDDPAIADARRDLAAASLAEYIVKVVDAAPPLTEDQRARLATLLRGGGAAA